MEQLYVFGTGNAIVTRCYNTCFAIKNSDGEYFMVDTGGGNGILRILEDMNVDMKRIHHIFLTHEHTDHLLGIVWLVRMISVLMKKELYDGNLYIYCHEDLVETVTTVCRLTLQPKFFKAIGDTIHLVAVKDGETRQILNWPVTFFDIHSTKAKQFGFTMTLEQGRRLTCAGDEPYNPLCEKFVAGLAASRGLLPLRGQGAVQSLREAPQHREGRLPAGGGTSHSQSGPVAHGGQIPGYQEGDLHGRGNAVLSR